MNGAMPVGVSELLIAASLVALSAAVSMLLRLGLTRRIAIASLRTAVQLLAVGYLLKIVFSVEAAWPVVVALLAMTGVAGWSALGRVERSVPGAFGLALVSIALSAFVATGVVTQLALGITPWYHAQYLIPLAGMVLGNSLTGISLAMDRLLAGLDEQREVVEERLAAGATPWEAARPLIVVAVRAAMVPTLNAMTVAGIVSLPGMMTGQILAGADPVQAVGYQIVIMFMLCGATALGGMLLGTLVFRSLLGPPGRIRFEVMTRRG
ncbi:MAG: iron export ABC transporter permease subunit FetB [Pseudomonadota bacterium]